MVEQVPSHNSSTIQQQRKAALDGNKHREQIAMATDSGETTTAGMSLTTYNKGSLKKTDDRKKNREQRRSLGGAPDRVMKRHDLDLAKTTSLPPLSTSFFDRFDNIVDNTDIPQFLKDHNATLRFPEKVSASCNNSARQLAFLSIEVARPHLFTSFFLLGR